MPVFDVFSVPFFVLFVFNSILAFLNFTLCKQVGCQSWVTNATRSKMLRILVNFDSLSICLYSCSEFLFV